MATRGGAAVRGAPAPSRGGAAGGPAAARGGASGGGAAPAPQSGAAAGAAPKDANVHHLAKCITCHAWSADRTRLALCPNDNTVEIWAFDGSAWNKEHVLDEHDQIVTGIDWAAKTNRLVTCSEDRNAYVWTYQANDGVWKPTLVILRINRAATNVRWSPNEDKFAVASGAKVVSVCYFEEDNDWWVSKHIKKHRSTVLCVDWHPSNLLILTGSADFTCRIFSAAVKGVDKKPRDAIGSFQAAALMQFGEQLMEMPAQGWVHSARFSPSGNLAAFVSHDSSVSICDISSAENQPWRVKHTGLPFHTCLFLNEYTLVVAGHEYKPYLVQQQQDGSWALTRNLDEKKAAAAGGPAKVNAFAMFANKVATGQDQRKGDKQETKHQNCITHLDLYQGSPDNVSAFTSSGIDGLVVVWNGPW